MWPHTRDFDEYELVMGSITVHRVGKAYKHYPSPWARLAEWLDPRETPRHRPHWVLQDIDFQLAPGEAVGIVGVNGAGKSTLLKIITGTLRPTTGWVKVEGRVAALLELGMGFHNDFTGRQNVFMAGQLFGWSPHEISALLPDIEAFADIGDYLDQPLRVYSSGMQMRLAFSVATAVRPDVLIVDEALSVGDVFFQQRCFERLRAFCQAGTTLLFVSHSLGSVYSLCQRALLLDHGRIICDSDPKTVLDLYNARALQAQQTALQVVAHAEASDDAVGSYSSPGVTIVRVALTDAAGQPVQCVVSGVTVCFRVTVRFHAAYADPHIGFQLRDARGEALFMSNTYGLRQPPGPVVAGDELDATFTFRAALAPGHYTLTCGVANGADVDGGFQQSLARRHDAIAFSVIKNFDDILWAGLYNIGPQCTVQRRPAAS